MVGLTGSSLAAQLVAAKELYLAARLVEQTAVWTADP